MYGTACNQTQLVLQAIQDTKVNMTIWIGAYSESSFAVVVLHPLTSQLPTQSVPIRQSTRNNSRAH